MSTYMIKCATVELHFNSDWLLNWSRLLDKSLGITMMSKMIAFCYWNKLVSSKHLNFEKNYQDFDAVG